MAFATAGMADQVTVDLSSYANGFWCNAAGQVMWGCSSIPTGMQNYNGESFSIAGGANNAWFSSVAANNGSTKVSLAVNTNVTNATSVSTLMNTFWGQSGMVLDSVTFGFSDGSTLVAGPLTGNNSLRDYNNYVWTNSIIAPTKGAFADTSQRLDEQTFSLGADAGKDLTSITISDWGNEYYSRVFLAALTVNTDPLAGAATTVPEPSYVALVGASLLGAGILFRRKKA